MSENAKTEKPQEYLIRVDSHDIGHEVNVINSISWRQMDVMGFVLPLKG